VVLWGCRSGAAAAQKQLDLIKEKSGKRSTLRKKKTLGRRRNKRRRIKVRCLSNPIEERGIECELKKSKKYNFF
jgi:hypothetical protein